MVQALLLDLGDTLVHDNAVLPGVPAALEALRAFRDASGKPLGMALVSDFDVPSPPSSAAKVAAIFAHYLQLLQGFGLERYFEPTKKHVTISAHAGVNKPDRKIFEVALKRLGSHAGLGDCIFITENAAHIAHCRDQLGMKTLQYGKDFKDWNVAPLLIAGLVSPEVNLQTALPSFANSPDLTDFVGVEREGDGSIRANAQSLVKLSDPALGEADGVHVRLPVRVRVEPGAAGRFTVEVGKPSLEDETEAKAYVKGLLARGELGPAGQLATHELKSDDQGRRVLVRRGYRAV